MAITPLPSAPQVTDDTATFNSKAFAWVDAIDTFTTEANAIAEQVNEDAITVASAADAAVAAIGAANYKGEWSDLTGALSIPASVSHNGEVWLLTQNLADVTSNEPGIGSPTVWLSLSPPASGGFSQAQIFTSSGTFTVPDSGKFKVTIIGAGGSGAKFVSTVHRGTAGGGGASVIKWFSGATAGTTATITIGSGGASQTVAGTNGNTGGTSSFDLTGFTLLQALGGAGGSATQGDFGGAGGVASGGDINIDGSRGGGNARNSSNNFIMPTKAGETIFGLSQNHFAESISGLAGSGYGSGSTGVTSSSNSPPGNNGICIVEY